LILYLQEVAKWKKGMELSMLMQIIKEEEVIVDIKKIVFIGISSLLKSIINRRKQI